MIHGLNWWQGGNLGTAAAEAQMQLTRDSRHKAATVHLQTWSPASSNPKLPEAEASRNQKAKGKNNERENMKGIDKVEETR